jgi:ketosteroid isomerase-like protein
VTGHAAIRSFWWPQDGSRTRITSFDWDIQELGGHQSLAFTRGISAVAWTYDRDTLHQISSSRSVNLSVLTRQADGRWLISHQMWGPPLP